MLENISVRICNDTYNNLNNDYEIIFNDDTTLSKIEDDSFEINLPNIELTSLGDLYDVQKDKLIGKIFLFTYFFNYIVYIKI